MKMRTYAGFDVAFSSPEPANLLSRSKLTRGGAGAPGRAGAAGAVLGCVWEEGNGAGAAELGAAPPSCPDFRGGARGNLPAPCCAAGSVLGGYLGGHRLKYVRVGYREKSGDFEKIV